MYVHDTLRAFSQLRIFPDCDLPVPLPRHRVLLDRAYVAGPHQVFERLRKSALIVGVLLYHAAHDSQVFPQHRLFRCRDRFVIRGIARAASAGEIGQGDQSR